MTTLRTKGFSLIELAIVAAVLALLFAVVLPEFGKSRERQVLSGATGDILSSLSKARAQTLASVDSSSYGVRFEPDKVIIFKGTSFTAGAPENETIGIVSPAAITDVTLGGTSGSTGSMYFNRLTGEPSAWGTVTLSSPSFSKVITITATGAAGAQ